MKNSQIHTLFSMSFLTNAISLIVLLIGWFLPEKHLAAIGSYALSGAMTNWLAIIMLFDKIPFLYGSGVIPARFDEFKAGIKHLIMDQFFTKAHIQRFFEGGHRQKIKSIDFTPVLNLIDYDDIFQSLVDTIVNSSLGNLLSFVGGREALTPLKVPFITALQTKLDDLARSPELANLFSSQGAALFDPETIRKQVEQIVDQRLTELTPQMVKLIIQTMIRKHLGWLVLWGGIFGGLIGLVNASLV